MMGIKTIVLRVLGTSRVERDAVDSARLEVDTVSDRDFQRVIHEADRLQRLMRMQRRHNHTEHLVKLVR